MNVLIMGASGFIGGHITDTLLKSGHQLTVCVRQRERTQQRWPNVHIVTADFSKATNVADWLIYLEGVDLVINAVGIIRESGSQTFNALHTESPCALFRACEQVGVKQVIQISALGADETAFSQYHLSKRAADECLMESNLNWTVLRPSIVYGPGAGSMAFFKALAALPYIPLVDKGDQQVQPIHIDDLVRVVLLSIQSEELKHQAIELVGPEPVTMKAMYLRLRHWLGLSGGRFISIPYRLSLIMGYLAGFLGNTPMTKESIQMLANGNTADVTPLVKLLGFAPVSFEQSMMNTPAQQADRWHAGLYFLKPMLRFSIAFLWIYTGIISAFIYPVEQSYSMLEAVGVAEWLRPVMLYGAAALDFGLGMALLLSYRIRLIVLVQITVIVLYSIIISFSQPEFWIHPFGPLSKNIPLIAATLILLVLDKK